MTDFKNYKYVFHITNIKNIPNILQHGLLPRAELKVFVDVSDHKIIDGRTKYNLENYVPFHFMYKSAFDYNIQKNNANETFVYIVIKREVAKENWKIIPYHPLSKHPITNEFPEMFDYEKGIEEIEWDFMGHGKDFLKEHENNEHGKKLIHITGMAECLSPGAVPVSKFHGIVTRTEESKKSVMDMIETHKNKKTEEENKKKDAQKEQRLQEDNEIDELISGFEKINIDGNSINSAHDVTETDASIEIGLHIDASLSTFCCSSWFDYSYPQ